MRDLDAAVRAQAAAAAAFECPSPAARAVDPLDPFGPAGFLWGAHTRPTPRAALSKRYCELPP